MIKRTMNLKGEIFGFRFSGMILGLGVTALIFFVSFFVSRQKMKSLGGLSRFKTNSKILIYGTMVKMKYKSALSNLTLSLTLFSSLTLSSQEIIFPGLKGDSLLTELKKYYTPKTILPYDQARTKLYTEVFQNNDSLECFYSGYKIPIPTGTNILAWTAKYGIQIEHLFPRSFGAVSLPALGDLHHLVPCKANVNTMRRNAPFGDIPDDITKYWILNDQVFLRPDQQIINEYSESVANIFEPREKCKGDIARALLYFYTIYGLTITKKNKSFFTSMLPDLCRWHRQDKVDSAEYIRSMDIARIQFNVNPFTIDPSLADRCFCKGYNDTPPPIYSVNIYPNPSKELFYIDILDYKGPLIMKISSQSGKLLETHHLVYSGLMSWRFTSGIYDLTFLILDNQIITKKVLIVP